MGKLRASCQTANLNHPGVLSPLASPSILFQKPILRLATCTTL